MKVILEIESKEIAAIILAAQEQQKAADIKPNVNNTVSEYVKTQNELKKILCDMRKNLNS